MTAATRSPSPSRSAPIPDINTVNVQNRVQLAHAAAAAGGAARRRHGREEVVGAAAGRRSSIRPKERFDALFLSNYATINMLDTLARVPGVGQASPVRRARLLDAHLAQHRPADGARPDARATSSARCRRRTCRPRSAASAPRRLTDDAQFQLNITTQGRLTEPEEFENVIVRANPDGSTVRVRDVAAVELGARTQRFREPLQRQARPPPSTSTRRPAPMRWPSPRACAPGARRS